MTSEMTNETRSPEEIEREIERERAGLTDTLDDLQGRFSVETIARQVSDQFREHGGDIGRSVSDAVKSNPVALALTGVGIAWLMMGNKSNDRDRYDRTRSYRRSDYDDGRAANTGLPNRPFGSSQSPASTLGPQPGNPAGSSSSDYRDGHNSRDLPSWARDDHDEDPDGIVSRIRGATSDAQESVAGAASAAGKNAREAGSTVADSVKGAAGAVSDTGKSVAEGAQNLASAASDRAAALRERIAQGTENLSEEARNRVIAARESALKARDAAASYTRHGRDRAVDIFEEQPLIAGALAVAVGAALGAALPRSRMEDQYFGEQSDQLMEEAERVFEEEKRKLGKVVHAATDEAKKVVSEARNDADDVAATAVEKAKSAGKRVADAAEAEADKQDIGTVGKS